jgi:hypothetical protein
MPGAIETEPGSFTFSGRRFTHGTLYAYTKGSCRCESCREAVAAYRTARRGQGQDRPPKELVPEEVRQARHTRRDWFRNRFFQPTIEAAELEWRPRVHDLRHASASWALAAGATVQQVREHLGRTSLRAVERYLHNLPGSEAGAAGAIARVRATGAFYPVIAPGYMPVPLVSVPTAAAVPVSPHEQKADTPSSAPQSQEHAFLDAGAAVPQHDSADTRAESGSGLVAAAIAPAAETVIVRAESCSDAGLPAACRVGEPEAEHVEIVAVNAVGEEPATQVAEPGLNSERLAAQKRSSPPQGRGRGRSGHDPNKKRRSGAAQNDHFRVQDRYNDDRQQTDGRTTPILARSVRGQTVPSGRERYLEHLRLKSQAAMLASGDVSRSASKLLHRG